MIRQEKTQAIESIKKTVNASALTVLADFRGVSVAQETELRKSLREQGGDYKVIKNRLMKLAIADNDFSSDVNAWLEGPTAIATHPEDPVIPAKVLLDFAKAHNLIEVKGAIMGDKAVASDKVKELASLPSRDVLLAKAIGSLHAPARGLVTVLSGVQRSLVTVLAAIRDQKQD